MQLRIFDFDQTLTVNHTFANCNNPKINNPLTADNNLKSDVGNVFKHENGIMSAIASYHNKPEYIKGYIEKILNKNLTLTARKTGEHEVISVYKIEGQKEPIVISTLRDENKSFNLHKQSVETTGKMVQINAVLSELGKSGYPAQNFSTMDFYDDDINNINKMNNSSISAHHVEVSNTFKVSSTKPATIKTTVTTTPKTFDPSLVLMTLNDTVYRQKQLGVSFESRGNVFVSSRLFEQQLSADESCEKINQSLGSNKFYVAQSSTGSFRICIQNDSALELLKRPQAHTAPTVFINPNETPRNNPQQTILDNLKSVLGENVEERQSSQYVSGVCSKADAHQKEALLKEIFPGLKENVSIVESRQQAGSFRVVVNHVNENAFRHVNMSKLEAISIASNTKTTKDYRGQMAEQRNATKSPTNEQSLDDQYRTKL